MDKDCTDAKSVIEFLKHRFPGDDVYEMMFSQVVALNRLFGFIYAETPTMFARMNEDCDAFQDLATLLINIQEENTKFHDYHRSRHVL